MSRRIDDRPAVTRLGLYRRGDRIYKVQESRETGRVYAKVLTRHAVRRLSDAGEVVDWTFEYAPGAVWSLTEADRLSVEDARAFGIQHGFCCVCARRLDDAESVAAGIGPICARRLGGGR